MLLYLVIFFIYLILGIGNIKRGFVKEKSEKKKVWYCFMLMSPMCLLTAFRSINVGNDTVTYSLMYSFLSDYHDYTYALKMSRLEPGYLFCSYNLNKIGVTYEWFQVIETIFIFYSWSKFFAKYSPRVIVSIFLFSVTIWFGTMNVVRMHLAIAILLYSIPYIASKQFLKFFIVLVMAMMFHYSAILFAILYPLSVIKYNKKTTYIILLCAVIISYLGASFFSLLTETTGMYESYTGGKYFSEDRNLTAVALGLGIQTVILIFLLLRGVLNPNQYDYDEDGNVLRNKINISYFCFMSFWINYALSIVGISNNIMNRLSGYFSICLMLLIPWALESYRNRNSRMIVFILVSASYLTKLIVQLVLRPNWNCVIPYDTF